MFFSFVDSLCGAAGVVARWLVVPATEEWEHEGWALEGVALGPERARYEGDAAARPSRDSQTSPGGERGRRATTSTRAWRSDETRKTAIGATSPSPSSLWTSPVMAVVDTMTILAMMHSGTKTPTVRIGSDKTSHPTWKDVTRWLDIAKETKENFLQKY